LDAVFALIHIDEQSHFGIRIGWRRKDVRLLGRRRPGQKENEDEGGN